MSIVFSEPFTLYSPLAPEECLSRIAASIGSEWFARWRGSEVVGKVSGTSLRLRKRIRYRNSFQTVLRGTVLAGQNGSIISGQQGMHPMVGVFMLFWVGMGIWIWRSFTTLLPLMFFAGLFVILLGRFLARNEASFLFDFLAKTVDARRTGRFGAQTEPLA